MGSENFSGCIQYIKDIEHENCSIPHLIEEKVTYLSQLVKTQQLRLSKNEMVMSKLAKLLVQSIEQTALSQKMCKELSNKVDKNTSVLEHKYEDIIENPQDIKVWRNKAIKGISKNLNNLNLEVSDLRSRLVNLESASRSNSSLKSSNSDLKTRVKTIGKRWGYKKFGRHKNDSVDLGSIQTTDSRTQQGPSHKDGKQVIKSVSTDNQSLNSGKSKRDLYLNKK